MFDVNFFLKAVALVLAVGGTLSTVTGLAYMWWITFTPRGKIDALSDLIHHRRVYVFSFKPLIIAIVGWIAVFSFR